MSACASLPDDLNSFFARFESSQAVEPQKDQELHCPFVLNRADVCKSFKRLTHTRLLDLMASLAVF